ncbi:MAG: prolipoprotein diacylglyceryl transferase family protein [Candidatus Zixiibacteriota bacterium]
MTYAIVYTVGMVTQVALAVWLCRRRGVTVMGGIALGLCYAFAMNTGARILYDILNRRFSLPNYFDPGYYMQRGMWGGPLVYLALALAGVLILARDRRQMADVVALTLPVPMILAKVSCFMNGCCYGAPCRLPWAVSLPPGSDYYTAPPGIPRHPTQIYEIVVLGIVQVVFLALNRERWKGTLVLWFLVLYGIGRPVTEFFRAAEKRIVVWGPLTSSQIVCLAAALAAGIALMLIKHRRGFMPQGESRQDDPSGNGSGQ